MASSCGVVTGDGTSLFVGAVKDGGPPWPRVVVVGAGVIGLSSALLLLEDLPNCSLTVIAENFSPNTTGDIAAGMWGPYLVWGTSPEHVVKWSKVSWDQFDEWYHSEEDWGVTLVPGTSICDTVLPPDQWQHIPLKYTTLTPQQVKQFGDKYIYGYSFSTYFAEPSKFLPKLAAEIERRGGVFQQRRLSALSDACHDADIVINCSGLGARSLVPDPTVIPVRGQVVRVAATGVKEYLCDESDETFAYILPNAESVVLGGTHEDDNWDTSVDDVTTSAIIDRCCRLMPSLKGARVLQCCVGLRPARVGGVRLERDDVRLADRTTPVVHNYGHSGCGVTLMWGCARDVVNIVRDIVRDKQESPQPLL